ncbi:alcohol dehydrogenase class-3-like [Mytilus trossulus]
MADTTGKIIKCKAAVMREHKKPLIIENIEVAPPKAGELRIKIMYSSICHSDENYLGGSRPWIVDSILGHEGAGIVESVGEGVTEFKAGDHVIPSFMGQCNQCRTCKSGKTNVCDVLKGEHYLKGGMLDGTVRFSCNGKPIYHYLNTSTFSQYTVASEWSCVKIDPAAPLDKACLLGCGIATGYGSAINTAKVEPGSVCAVWGLGTIGLAVVMGCRNAGASRIIGIDTNPAKFEIAKKFGMTEGVNPKDFKEPLQDVLLKMTNGGLDYAFECIGNVKTMKVAFDSVHRCWGKVLIIGVAPITDEFVTNPYAITMGKQVIGSLYGDYKVKTISNLVTEYMNKKLMVDEFVTHKMGLDKINEGFDLLRSGKSLRTVLDMWA